MRAPIQGLWIGSELSTMERLSIQSFLHQGHAYHLYVYEEVRNIPDAVVLKDAGEVLPASMIFRYRKEGSYAGFANFFRYKLLLEHGGWWADTDVVCVQPFAFAGDYVFGSESDTGGEVVSTGVIRAVAGSAVMTDAWRVCQSKNTEELEWGETGPRLLQALVRKFALEQYVQPVQVFSPVAWWQWRRVLDADWLRDLPPATRAIHLWNEMWRREGCDKNRRHHPDCLYERLKRRYGVT